MMTRCIIFILILLAAGCARFRIEELKPSAVFSVPFTLENEPGNYPARRNGRVLFNFPVFPAVRGGKAFIPDQENQQLYIYQTTGGSLQKVIGENAPQGIPLTKVKTGIPGRIVTDEDGNYYLQSFPVTVAKPEKPVLQVEEFDLPPEERHEGRLSVNIGTLPSVILVFNSKDEPVGLIQNETAPFSSIYWMDTGKNGKLFVMHKHNQEKALSIYEKSNRIALIVPPPPGTEAERKKYTIIVEDIFPDESGEHIILCAAFRDKTNFQLQFRRLYQWKNNSLLEIYQTDEPEDFFAGTRSDGGFYILNSDDDGRKSLYKIYGPDGEYKNNILLEYPGPRTTWRETFITLDGKFLTTRIFNGRYELYEWK